MLEKEEAIVEKLKQRFSDLAPVIQRERRIWAEVSREKFLEVLGFLCKELGFYSLCTVTGLDCEDQFQLIYHVAESGSKDGGIIFSLKESAPKSDPVFDTATELYKGGTLYELEARNLLGLTIRGIPDDIRYPLPDSWSEGQYPLRKQWHKNPISEEEK